MPAATAKLTVRSADLNLRREPSSNGGNSTVVRVLHAGDVVDQVGYHEPDPSWTSVRTADGMLGFVKRMLLFQSSLSPLASVPQDVLKAYNDAVWKATSDFDRVTYKLGAKDPREGRVDCSGWIAFVNRLAFNAANAAAGSQLFSAADLQIFNTHSDHQVSIPGYRTAQLFSIEAVASLAWRPGLLIGINFSDYDWERGQGRVFEIDHIVQTMAASDGTLLVTQSSSGGGGVNRAKLRDWLSGRIDELRAANRVHVVDVFGLASGMAPMAAPRRDITELPELDVSRTPPG